MDSTQLYNVMTALIALLLTVVGFLLVFVLNHILKAITKLQEAQSKQQAALHAVEVETASHLATKVEIHELWVEIKELRELHKATYDHILQVLMEIKVSLAGKVDKDECTLVHRTVK